MAGIGIQLTKIFNKHTIITSIYGIGFSIMYTIAPMLLVVGCLLAMHEVLNFDQIGYLDRELFSTSLLYIFIFSLLTSSPFNSVLSKFQTDKIFEQRYEDVRPCIYVGTITNLTFSSLISLPFYIYEVVVGKVEVYYVFTTYMAFLGLTLTFSTMVYNSILKQYKKISLYFLYSMITTFILSLIFRYLLKFTVTYSMLLAFAIGFLMIAALGLANVLRYFPGNSHVYREVLHYFRIYWKLIVSNFLYTFGLFAHNFIYWTQSGQMIVRDTYICNPPYDMASCLAMITSITATVLFISRIEMHFHERYKEYTECVIGGKLVSIEKAKKRMFRGLSSQLLSLVHIQFIVTIVLFLLAIVIFPLVGFAGVIMDIYPMLAVGYFIAYLMYSELLFLYYYDDMNGAAINSIIFAGVTIAGSILTSGLPEIWYGAGFTVGAFLSFTYSYFRLSWIEKNIDSHIFCRGTLLKQMTGKMPDSKVYSVYKNKGINKKASDGV